MTNEEFITSCLDLIYNIFMSKVAIVVTLSVLSLGQAERVADGEVAHHKKWKKAFKRGKSFSLKKWMKYGGGYGGGYGGYGGGYGGYGGGFGGGFGGFKHQKNQD